MNIKQERIINVLSVYTDVIINGESQDDYEVTCEDIVNIAESIEDDIKGDSFEAIVNYIDEYIEKNQWFDVTGN